MAIYTTNNKIWKLDNKWVNKPDPVDPYNPLGLPDNTIRVKFTSGYTPAMGDTQTLVDSTNNVWDIYKQSNNWYNLFANYSDLLEVLGANTTNVTRMGSVFRKCSSLTNVALFDTSNVTDMSIMFMDCTSLTSVPLFDTSKVTNMEEMFGHSKLTSIPLFDTSSVINMAYMFNMCNKLTSIPLFDTSKVTSMSNMFYGCTMVDSGALALYQQASSQTNPPSSHSNTFYNCGRDTTTGAAELAQIPSSWGGTGA